MFTEIGPSEMDAVCALIGHIILESSNLSNALDLAEARKRKILIDALDNSAPKSARQLRKTITRTRAISASNESLTCPPITEDDRKRYDYPYTTCPISCSCASCIDTYVNSDKIGVFVLWKKYGRKFN